MHLQKIPIGLQDYTFKCQGKFTITRNAEIKQN